MDTHKNTNKSNRHYKFIIWMVFCLCAASAVSADQILVQAGDMKLMMEKTEQGISMLSLFDNIAGQELLSPNTRGIKYVFLCKCSTKAALKGEFLESSEWVL